LLVWIVFTCSWRVSSQRAYDALLARGLITAEQYRDRWTWRHLHQRAIGRLLHEAAVTEVRLALMQACRTRPGVKLLSCRSDPPIWRQFVTNGERRSLRPDREVEMIVPDTQQPCLFFVEVDRGTRTIVGAKKVWTVQRQLQVYEEYARVTASKPYVLMLCPSHERIASITENVRRRPTRSVVLFAVWDEFIHAPFDAVLREEDPRTTWSLLHGLSPSAPW
jgi:hypothetical protein